MPLFGKNATTYYSSVLFTSAGQAAADALTWSAVTNITDETDNFNPVKVDTTTRASAADGFGTSALVLNDMEITFTMLKESTDTNFAAIWTAIQTGAPLALMFLSGDKTSTSSIGVAANWTLALNWEKPIKDVQKQVIVASIYQYPGWIVGASTL